MSCSPSSLYAQQASIILTPQSLSWCTSAKGGLGVPREQETPEPDVLRGNNTTRKNWIGGEKQGLLRSESEAASNLPAATAQLPGRKGSLTCSRHCPHATTRHTSLLQAGSNGFSWLSFHWIQQTREPTGKISSLPLASACQEPGEAPLPGAVAAPRSGGSPRLLPGQVHSPAGWRLSKPAAALGDAPEPRRCAGATPPSSGRIWPLATHRSWKVAHFLPAGGEGVPEQLPGSKE